MEVQCPSCGVIGDGARGVCAWCDTPLPSPSPEPAYSSQPARSSAPEPVPAPAPLPQELWPEAMRPKAIEDLGDVSGAATVAAEDTARIAESFSLPSRTFDMPQEDEEPGQRHVSTPVLMALWAAVVVGVVALVVWRLTAGADPEKMTDARYASEIALADDALGRGWLHESSRKATRAELGETQLCGQVMAWPKASAGHVDVFSQPPDDEGSLVTVLALVMRTEGDAQKAYDRLALTDYTACAGGKSRAFLLERLAGAQVGAVQATRQGSEREGTVDVVRYTAETPYRIDGEYRTWYSALVVLHTGKTVVLARMERCCMPWPESTVQLLAGAEADLLRTLPQPPAG